MDPLNYYTCRKHFHASPGENLLGPEICICGLIVSLSNYVDGRDWNKISREEFMAHNKEYRCEKCFQAAARALEKGIQKQLVPK